MGAARSRRCMRRTTWNSSSLHGATGSPAAAKEMPSAAVRRRPDMSRRMPSSIHGRLGWYSFDSSAPITAGTWTAAYAATQVALTAADLLSNGESSAFALCRRPGHHASRGLLRRLLLSEQCRDRHTVPARPRPETCGNTRRRFSPWQRHAIDFLRTQRRAVRVNPRRPGRGVPVFLGSCR